MSFSEGQPLPATATPAASAWGVSLRRHAMLAAFVGAYFVLSVIVSLHFEFKVSGGAVKVLLLHFVQKVPQMAFLVLFWRLLHLTYVQKRPDRIGILKTEVRGFLSDADRMRSAFVAVLLMSLVLMAFGQLKSAIPLFQPFSWDVFFAGLDRTLHFGVDPYKIVQAVFGGYYSLSLFTGLYNFWLFLAYFVLFAACFARPDSATRMQFLLAFLFTWGLAGNLVATLFSSAGPPYYARLGLGDTFAPLTEALLTHAKAGGLTVVATQDVLWNIYTRPNGLNPISAFPSMHVASSVLMAIYGFSFARWLGLALSLFALAIMIGSVLLGWHYAVDGYAGALIAVGCWLFAGWLVRSRFGPFPAGT